MKIYFGWPLRPPNFYILTFRLISFKNRKVDFDSKESRSLLDTLDVDVVPHVPGLLDSGLLFSLLEEAALTGGWLR